MTGHHPPWTIALLLLLVMSSGAGIAAERASPTTLPHQFGAPLPLRASDHLPPASAQPWLQTLPGNRDYFAAWPEQVDLRCYQYGYQGPEPARRVLLIGGIHGDEAVSYILAELLHRQLAMESERIATNPPQTFTAKLESSKTQLFLIPLVNPYGTVAGVRANFRKSNACEDSMGALGAWWASRPEWWDRRKGTDPNRNFPTNLPDAGHAYQRDDGEGTHHFNATGGCHEQELYYGGLLQFEGEQPDPANQWVMELIQMIQPDVTIALHQEARVMYVDTAYSKVTSEIHWAPFIAQAHRVMNEARAPITMGKRVDGSVITPDRCVNNFSPGGYGATLSLHSGVVLTLEMTTDQSDALDEACWFPEGMLATYAGDLALTKMRNQARLELVIDRFAVPLVHWMLYLDPQCPGEMRYDIVPGSQCRALLPPNLKTP